MASRQSTGEGRRVLHKSTMASTDSHITFASARHKSNIQMLKYSSISASVSTARHSSRAGESIIGRQGLGSSSIVHTGPTMVSPQLNNQYFRYILQMFLIHVQCFRKKYWHKSPNGLRAKIFKPSSTIELYIYEYIMANIETTHFGVWYLSKQWKHEK